MMSPPIVVRAPMRARDRDLPQGAGAAFGVARGLVGTGDALPAAPPQLDAAVLAATHVHGEKAGRMLSRFAALPVGTLAWTRLGDDDHRLGRIEGPWRYADDREAAAAGIHHVRPARWLARTFTSAELPAAVAATFARGGRNLQRVRDPAAATHSHVLWTAATS